MITERHIADAFDLGGRVLDVRPLGRGLINDTFLVSTDASGRGRGHAVLQRISRRAFPQPELIMQNLRLLTDHLRERGDSSRLRLPAIHRTRDGKDYLLDTDGGFWRALGYIENTVSFEHIESSAQAAEVGAALGRFHALVGDLDARRMRATRPWFHDTPRYLEHYTDVIKDTTQQPRSAELAWCMAFVDTRQAGASSLEAAKLRGDLVLRVIHGDPKLNNFLFDAGSGRIVGLIDLDTVQPGLLHYDIGDCLRSSANPGGESPPSLDDVRFDLDIAQAILASYLAETHGLLTPRDIGYLYESIRLIAFELGLRFLTDHLEGDPYFKVETRGQNLYRATAQFRLSADIEKNERRIKKLVTDLDA